MKNFLPIGSVLKIQDIDQKVMVYGRLQKQKDGRRVFDYAGCMYPYGNLNDEEGTILFDGESIEKMYFLGYQDHDEINVRNILQKEYEKLKVDQSDD